MPRVNLPVMCMSCKGEGRVAPITIFRQHRDKHLTECANCGGSGTIDNFVFVNPHIHESHIKQEKESVDESNHEISVSNEETKNVIEEVKKVTSTKFKKAKKDAVCG
ncbi:MAG: hypothetical protein ACTHME_05235 [Candidatus Nitrosocosmicus sp.]